MRTSKIDQESVAICLKVAAEFNNCTEDQIIWYIINHLKPEPKHRLTQVEIVRRLATAVHNASQKL